MVRLIPVFLDPDGTPRSWFQIFEFRTRAMEEIRVDMLLDSIPTAIMSKCGKAVADVMVLPDPYEAVRSIVLDAYGVDVRHRSSTVKFAATVDLFPFSPMPSTVPSLQYGLLPKSSVSSTSTNIVTPSVTRAHVCPTPILVLHKCITHSPKDLSSSSPSSERFHSQPLPSGLQSKNPVPSLQCSDSIVLSSVNTPSFTASEPAASIMTSAQYRIAVSTPDNPSLVDLPYPSIQVESGLTSNKLDDAPTSLCSAQPDSTDQLLLSDAPITDSNPNKSQPLQLIPYEDSSAFQIIPSPKHLRKPYPPRYSPTSRPSATTHPPFSSPYAPRTSAGAIVVPPAL